MWRKNSNEEGKIHVYQSTLKGRQISAWGGGEGLVSIFAVICLPPPPPPCRKWFFCIQMSDGSD